MPADGPLSLADAIAADTIVVHPEAEDRTAVIRGLVRLLVDKDRIEQNQASTVTRLVNEREAMGSTALGNGVALPHARVRFTDEVIIAFALLRAGKGFNALDGAPVRHVFLCLTPKDDDALHIRCLKAITGFVRDPIHLKALSGCKSPAEVHAVLRDYS